ncbi:MAG: hypothetical protein MUC49_13965 [Raineya sp.]|jgi:hypothetical protein|nr:hypothetical protein [Raineya sp.]
MTNSFSILIILLLLTNCSGKKLTFDQNGKIQKLGIPKKIEYFKHEGKAFQYAENAMFVITDKKELMSIMNEIQNADNPELWKGAGWDKIRIHFTDTILNINTNNKKIGTSTSGTFYDLKKDNFITKRMNEK